MFGLRPYCSISFRSRQSHCNGRASQETVDSSVSTLTRGSFTSFSWGAIEANGELYLSEKNLSLLHGRWDNKWSTFTGSCDSCSTLVPEPESSKSFLLISVICPNKTELLPFEASATQPSPEERFFNRQVRRLPLSRFVAPPRIGVNMLSAMPAESPR